MISPAIDIVCMDSVDMTRFSRTEGLNLNPQM